MRVAHLRRLLVLGSLAASSALARPASLDGSSAVSNWVAPPYWMPPAERAHGIESKHPMLVSSPALAFHAVTPCRIVDTRGNGFTGPYGPPSLVAAAVRSFSVTSPGTSCGIPSGAAAVSFNFAAVSMSAAGNLIVYPTGGSTPTVSSLNWNPVEGALSNAAVIPLGSDSISVVVNGPVGSTVDLVVDVNGYYAADPVVTSLNGISGAVTLVPGGDVTVTPAGPNVTIGTNATSADVGDTLVRRDLSGSFSAALITANVIGAASANVQKAGDTMTGTLTMNGGDLDLGASGRVVRGSSLYFHSSGASNTFAGLDAGNATTTGFGVNAAFGNGALHSLAGGFLNVAVGGGAGGAIADGNYNVAVGAAALAANAGDSNVAIGYGACNVCTGLSNTAIGNHALIAATGSFNIAVGAEAGSSGPVGPGNNNIYIGHTGATKSDGLLRLRPVAFRYKPELDPEGIEQFGLIAEEVEKVYPGLVTCGEDGEPQAVRYHFLVPMLLNEVQKDRQELDRSRAELADVKARLERLESLLAEKGR